ncbi:diadenylate cyclase CdaA [Treponema sp.]|uniref:diadenylate cyclase CdaA n=1 Tax=Treponema sp. TaxID=166 RepID=UPI003FA25FE6
MGSLERFPEIYEYIRPVLDIGVLAFILYKMYGLIVKTQSLQIIKFGFTVLTAYVIALILNLSMLLWLLHLLAPGVLIGFAIVFQPELRKIIFKLGQTQWFKFRRRTKHAYIDSVLIAAEMLSKQKRGMLAVFTRKTSLKDIMDTGTYLNADLTSSLLVTIFGHDTPLHDGAAVIQDGKITAAGCFLPLSEQYDIRKTFGTRHRAALGVSEETDAVVLIVSEESGAISLAYDSHLHYDLTMEQLTATLENLLEITSSSADREEAA